MLMLLDVIEQAEFFEGGNYGLTGLIAVHAAELAVALHHMRGLVEDVDLLQAVGLAHRPVVRVVSRCDLHET